MNEWLMANLGVTFPEVTVLLGFIGSILLNIFQFREGTAARTIALNDATIRNLETSLTEARHKAADQKTEKDTIEQEIKDKNTRISAIEGDKIILQGRISELEKLMSERPSLIAWGNNTYREAFPDNPDDPKTHKFYCATCWDRKRMVTLLKPPHACEHWREDWHDESLPTSPVWRQ